MTYGSPTFGGPPFYILGEFVDHGLTGMTEMCGDFVRSALMFTGVCYKRWGYRGRSDGCRQL